METYPNLKEEVGSSLSGSEISNLLDRNLSGGQPPHVPWRKPVGLLSKKRKGSINLGFKWAILRHLCRLGGGNTMCKVVVKGSYTNPFSAYGPHSRNTHYIVKSQN